jgi:hypothetical protein
MRRGPWSLHEDDSGERDGYWLQQTGWWKNRDTEERITFVERREVGNLRALLAWAEKRESQRSSKRRGDRG